MARIARIVLPGIPHHVTQRGNRRQQTFFNAQDYEAYVSLLARACARHVNFREGWRGHLWQERFHSFAMDESYLLATVRYVELNPVKAQLVERPQDWRWSSARSRLGQVVDGLTNPEPLQQLVHDWPAFWGSTLDERQDAIQLHTRTGRPLGAASFVEMAEAVVGRVVRRQKPGPKRELPTDDQMQLDV